MDLICLSLLPPSVSIRVSNELGAGRAKIARLAVCAALFMVVIEGIIAATAMTLGHHVWGYCYSSEERVVKYVGQMLMLISVSHFFDGIQSVLSGFSFFFLSFFSTIKNKFDFCCSFCMCIETYSTMLDRNTTKPLRFRK